MGNKKTTGKDVLSVTDTGSWDSFLSADATDNHNISYHTKLIMSTIIAVQVTFLINFAGKVTCKLLLSNKGKS